MASAPTTRVHGGCINESYRWESGQGPLFVKVAQAPRLAMLEAEALGLEELAHADAVRVPRMLAVGLIENAAYLALEWLDLIAPSPATAAERGEQLLERMGALFAGYRPAPSLLHGDFWGGNWGADANGAPIVFDPAVYYGDREADIAMTRLLAILKG